MTRPYDWENPPSIGEIIEDDYGSYMITAWKFNSLGEIKALVGNKWYSAKNLYKKFVNENGEKVGAEVIVKKLDK